MKKTGRMFAAAILWSILSPGIAASQQDHLERESLPPKQPGAPVIVDGYFLFSVHGITAYPGEERARNIEGRIAEVALDDKFSADDLSIVEMANETDIMAGERLVMGIVELDADLEGIPRQILANIYMEKIAHSITSYRNERTRSAITSKVIHSAGVLVAGAALLFLILRLSRWLATRIEARYRSKIQGFRIQSFQLVQAEQLWLAVRGMIYMARTVLMLMIILACTEYVLSLYPWTRYLSQRIIALVLDPFKSMIASIMGVIPDLIFITILFLVVRYALKLIRLFFAGVGNGAIKMAGFSSEWALPSYKITRFLIIAFAVVVAYPYIPGAGSDAFKGVSIFVGVIFSLGSTSVVSNTIAGYSMIFRRLFRIGDRVKIGDHIGDVEQIRLQVTHLRSLKNEEIILPNSMILNSHVINYSSLAKARSLILHTTVGIGYETPWRQVESMLLMAAERTPELLRQPQPFILQKALGDFCVTYEMNVYCDRPHESAQLYTALHRNILDVFNQYGVQIMTPAYVSDTDKPKVVTKDRWFEAPASPPPDEQ